MAALVLRERRIIMATLFADPFNALFQFQQALDAFRTSVRWMKTEGDIAP